jgi:biopolymer transport protein ExbB
MTHVFLAASFSSIYHFFAQGGFFMILLLICSVVSVAVIILRGLALRRELVMPATIEREIESLQPDDTDGVVRLSRLVRNDLSALARVIKVGLQHLNWPKSENIEAVQTRARHELVRLESGLFVLEVIVGIAPLLGLLGAVSGLVTVFASLGASANISDPRGIAKGISEALSTTIVGLAIAIPSLISHSYFSKKIETMAAEMESLIADLLAKCYYQKYKRISARITPATGPSPIVAADQTFERPAPDRPATLDPATP